MERAHKVAGIYASEEAARAASREIVAAGFDAERVRVVVAANLDEAVPAPEGAGSGAEAPASEGDDTATKVAGGAAAGGAGGLTAAAAAAATGASVVLAAPLAASLVAAGFGAVLGSAAAGLVSARVSERYFAGMVREAVARGYAAVIVTARDEPEALKAQDTVSRTAARQSIDQHGGVARHRDRP